MRTKVLLAATLLICPLCAQDKRDSQAATLELILERLNSLEKENQQLAEEVKALRQELSASHLPPAASSSTGQPSQSAPLEERVAVTEKRIDEQAQTKVEASQKFPVSLTGMLLFNAFVNSRANNPGSPLYSDLLTGPDTSGATLRQTLLGLRFSGPSLPGGGKVNGDLMMDFFGGSAYPQNNWLRIRRAMLTLDWENRTFSVGQDKPLISPREPNSLAEVGVPALADSGNLWLWLPQARYEERIHLGQATGLNGQAALLETNESYASVPEPYSYSLETARPAIEGRFAFWHKWGENGRFEFAPGFHASATHVAYTSVSSRVASLDWLFTPSSKFHLTGAFFKGHNFASLGALPDSFTVLGQGGVIPVHGTAGWLQSSYAFTNRLTFNLFAGVQANRTSDLQSGAIMRNFSYAGNLMYRLGPNVLVGLEALQLRSSIVSNGNQVHNHYDLALAYLF